MEVDNKCPNCGKKMVLIWPNKQPFCADAECANAEEEIETPEDSLTIRAQVWKAQADDCPARCGCRCNLNGEMCTMDHCFGLYWNGLKTKGTGGE